MNFRRRNRKRPRLEIVPMVDVMTFLIVFFMLFTTFRTNSAGLDVKLPRAATAVAQQPTRIVVTIDRAGEVYLNDHRSSIGALAEELGKHVKAGPNETVVIRADGAVSYSRLVQVMDAARLAGAARLALAAEKPR